MRFAFLYLLPRVYLERIGYSLKVPGVFAVNVCSFTFFFRGLHLWQNLYCLVNRVQSQISPLDL